MSDLRTCGNCKRPLPHMSPTCLKNLMDDVDDLKEANDLKQRQIDNLIKTAAQMNEQLNGVHEALQEYPWVPEETFIGKDDVAAKVTWLVRHAKLLYQNNQGAARHLALNQQVDELKRQLGLVEHERDYLHGEVNLLEDQRNRARATVRALAFAARCSTRMVGDVLWWSGEQVGEVRGVPSRGGEPKRFYWLLYDVLLPNGCLFEGGTLSQASFPSREKATSALIEHAALTVMEHLDREQPTAEG